jgi:glyoxylase I family protein
MVDRRTVILGTATLAAVGTAHSGTGHGGAGHGGMADSGTAHGSSAGSGTADRGTFDSGTAGTSTAASASPDATAEAGAAAEPGAAAKPGAAAEPGAAAQASANKPAERVLGIGGFFFRSHDPKKLAQWYQLHLGIDPIPTEYGHHGWQQAAGETAFAPFPMDTDYFGSKQQGWMVNYRVRNLDAMVAQLQKANIEVKVDPQKYPNGRFARLHDPEGNPVELWEPAGHK